MKNIKQKLILIGILVILIIIAIVFLPRKKSQTPVEVPISITKTIPENNSSSVSVFDPILITFNQNIDPLTINVTSEPSENWSISQESQNSIRIDHKLNLEVATTYKLKILQHGNTIGELLFETTRSQNDPRQLQELKSELDKDYPLASSTPYENSDFRVVYSSPLTLQINIKSQIKGSDAISQVQMWVKSKGVDPATHKYNVVPLSSTPQP